MWNIVTKGYTMSKSYDIDHISTSVEDVSVEVAAKSEMVKAAPTGIKDVTAYVLASGDNAYPANVSYQSTLQSRGDDVYRRISVKFSTWANMTDSVTGEVVKKPLIGEISYLIPSAYTVEVADLDDAAGNLFSFQYPSVTTKVRSTAWLQKLLYGATDVA